MKTKRKKLRVCFVAALVSLAYFIFAVLIFQAPGGFLGFILCLASILTFIASMLAIAKIKNSSLTEAVVCFIFCIFDFLFPFL